MAVFDIAARLTHAVDWRLVQDSFVTLFRQSDPLDATTTWLREHGYKVIVVTPAHGKTKRTSTTTSPPPWTSPATTAKTSTHSTTAS